MNRLSILFSVSIVTVLFACNSIKESSSTSSSNTTTDSKESAVLWQQTSAEYTALCYQAFNAAKSYLSANREVNVVPNSTVGIVMDLDETVLDNSPYNGYLINTGTQYNVDTWKEWTDKAEAELIPGALEFIQYVQSIGYPLYFISNRREDELLVTIQNLDSKGINISEENVMLRGSSRSKSERRQKVISKSGIFMLIGDNLSDFDDLFEESLSVTMRKDLVHKKKEAFGRRFIVLPNVMYGDWERTLKIPDAKAEGTPNAKGKRKFIKSFAQ